MQLIRDIYASKGAAGRPVISFEVFPPKTDEGERNLLQKTIPALLEARPDYCSVTYGAGGSTRDKTLRIVERIQREHGLTTLAHLTCVNHTREQVGALLDRIQGLGCRNILALRGDPPDGGLFQPPAGGFRYAAELVAFTRQQGGEFSIGVAGFPEGHIACAEGKLADWKHLKNKIDAGADFVITQLFFDNTDFLALRDFLVKSGVKVPVVPGMIAILSASQIKRFTQLCGARLPPAVGTRLDQLEQDDAAAAEFGIEYASRQCEHLLREGVPGFHFYTLNKARSTLQVLKNIGLA